MSSKQFSRKRSISFFLQASTNCLNKTYFIFFENVYKQSHTKKYENLRLKTPNTHITSFLTRPKPVVGHKFKILFDCDVTIAILSKRSSTGQKNLGCARYFFIQTLVTFSLFSALNLQY